MYNLDQIIASAYFVFQDSLTSVVISKFIETMQQLGIKFKRDNLRLVELKDVIFFENGRYKLAEGKSFDKITSFVDENLVAIFRIIQVSRNNYYENRYQSTEPSYQSEEKPKVYSKREKK